MPDPWVATLFPLHSPGPVQLEGHTLWLAYWLEVEAGDCIHIIFESVTGARRQGLRIAFEKYFNGLQLDGDEANKCFLWAQQGLRAREVDIVRAEVDSTLSIANCWLDEATGRPRFADGPAWLEPEIQSDGSVLLRASDGTTPVGDPTLVVRLVHERHRKLERAT